MDVQTRAGMPLDEFIRQYDLAPFELVDGERIHIVPPVAIHVYVISRLLKLLFAWAQQHDAGEVFTESTFVQTDVSNWVKGSRVPDIAFYARRRWDEYLASTPDWDEKPIALIPDLCVEVVSKTDNYEDVDDKVAEYLRLGVRLVWVIKPRNRSITVYGAGWVERLSADDTLAGKDVLPGFAASVGGIFPSS